MQRIDEQRPWLAWACLCWLMLAAPTLQAATTAEINNARTRAIAWLLSNQQGDGSWRSGAGSEIQTTATALQALARAGVTGASFGRGLAWIANAEAYSVDALAHQIRAMASVGMDTSAKLQQLIDWRNRLSAWGSYDRYSTSFPDTPLASSAIRTDSATYTAERTNLLKAMCQIIQSQKTDGSWNYVSAIDETLLPSDTGAILPTVYNILELSAFIRLGDSTRTCSGTAYSFVNVVNGGLGWLASQRLRADGGFSEPGTKGSVGTPFETALVYRVLSLLLPSDPVTAAAHDFLINNTQQSDGSWQNNALVTAMAATTFPAGVFTDTDKDGVPDAVETVLGMDPSSYDSRILATGNGRSVAGVTTSYIYSATYNQSVSFALPTQFRVGADPVTPNPSDPTLVSAFDFGTITQSEAVEVTLPVWKNPYSSAINMFADSGLPAEGFSVVSGNDVWVAPGDTHWVTVRFDGSGQALGAKQAGLWLSTWGGPCPIDDPYCYRTGLGSVGFTGNIGLVSAPNTYNGPTGSNPTSIPTGWKLVQGALPDGMVLSSTTGSINGTATSAGIYNYTLSATDSATGEVVVFSGRIVIDSPPVVSNPGTINSSEGGFVSLNIQSADPGGDVPIYSSSGLPSGLSIDPMDGRISGTVAVGSAGAYQVTVTVDDGVTPAVSMSFTWIVDQVTGEIPTVTTTTTPALKDGTLGMAWSGVLSPTSLDWIGVYQVGSVDTSYLSWSYTDGTNRGKLTLALNQLNLVPGIDYEVRLYTNDSYTRLSTSAPFRLNPIGPTVIAASTPVTQGGTLSVAWAGIANPVATDWVGVYAPGAPDTAFLDWAYTDASGAGSLRLLLNDPRLLVGKQYEVRLHQKNTFARLATSGGFVLQEGSIDDNYSYTIVSSGLTGAEVWVVSLSDNNMITAGSTILKLNQYERGQIPAGVLTQGMVVSGEGPFDMGGSVDATDVPVSNRLAGTRFVMPHARSNHWYYLVSPEGDATVQVDVNGVVTPLLLPKGQVVEFNAGYDSMGTVLMTSSRPILVAHRGDTGSSFIDASPVPPAALELWGVRTNASAYVGALEDNTTINIYADDGSSVTNVVLNAGQRYTINTVGAGGAQGSGSALRILSDKPVGAIQSADGDGIEQTAFMPTSELGIRFGLPTAAQYVAVVCPSPSTTVTLYDGVNAPQSKACGGLGVNPGKAYFGSTTNGSNIGAGAYLESDQPVYMIYEDALTNDEHNLMGYQFEGRI